VLEFASPLWFALAPLPLLVWRYAPPHQTSVDAVRAPFFQLVAELTGTSPSRGAVVLRRRFFTGFTLVLAWLLALTALANPTLRGQTQETVESARDLLLAVDLSGSMDARDFEGAEGKVRRMDGVKQVLNQFLDGRQGDRIGLIAFGGAPYVQAPFTADTKLVRRLASELDVGMAGDSTMLGDAIGLAIDLFERSKAERRVLILLTDGNDTGSSVPPLQAARMAKDQGVVLHVVGVGDPSAVGEDALDDELLKNMAELTGGIYEHASDASGLSTLFAQIDALEPEVYATRSWTPTRSVATIPTQIMAGMGLLFLLVTTLRSRARA